MIEVKYKGKAYSLNEAYNSHWAKKKKRREEIINLLDISQTGETIATFTVKVSYNSRLDVDNVTPLIKLSLDHLRRLNLLVDDSPKYWKDLNISHDAKLSKDTYSIKVIPC